MSAATIDPNVAKPSASDGTAAAQGQFNDIVIAAINSHAQSIDASSSSALFFIYTATGAEGADFIVTFPAPLTTTTYAAHVCGAGLAAFLLFDVPVANYALGQIRVLSSAALTAGDKLAVIVAY